MSLSAFVPLAIAGLLASAAAMTWGVADGAPLVSGGAAAAYGLLLVLGGLAMNVPFWRMRSENVRADAIVIAGLRNGLLMGLTYAWGAAALTAIYLLSGVRWQHGLQYAAGMAVFALVLFAFAREIVRPESRLRSPLGRHRSLQLTIVHGAAAALGLAFLVSAGKLASAKGDWPANQVFLVGGLVILALCIVAGITQRRLGVLLRQMPPAPPKGHRT